MKYPESESFESRIAPYLENREKKQMTLPYRLMRGMAEWIRSIDV